MGVSIDNGGVMHDVAVASATVTEASAARAADLLTSIDVNNTDTVPLPGYTTPPRPSHAPARSRAMQASYSDISDDANDMGASSHSTVDVPPIDKTSRPLMTSPLTQRTTAALKRTHAEQAATVSNI